MNISKNQAIGSAVGLGGLFALVQTLQDETLRLIGICVLGVLTVALVYASHRSDPGGPPPPQTPPKA